MIDRRQFLQWGLAAPMLLPFPVVGRAASKIPQNTIVVIDGIHSDTDPDKIAVVLDVLAEQGLPVTCLIDAAPQNLAKLRPNNVLSKLLKKKLLNQPGLVQLAPIVRNLAALTPYFQARAVYDAQSALQQALWDSSEMRSDFFISSTIACDMLDSIVAPSGVRACGIRNVLMRPQITTRLNPEAWSDGVVRLIGGQRLLLWSPELSFQAIPTLSVERVLYLSADDFSARSLASLRSSALAFTKRVMLQNSNYWINPILASDIQYRDNYGYKRNIALHFIAGADASPEFHNILTDFRLELINAGLPSSFAVDALPSSRPGYWIDVEGTRAADSPIRPVDLFNATDGAAFPEIDVNSSTTFGTAVVLSERSDTGLDARNILKLPSVQVDDEKALKDLATGSVGTADCVLVISDNILRDRPQRIALKRALYEIARDGISDVTTLPDYVRRIVPTGPYLTHFRRTQNYQKIPEPALVKGESNERERLMADAKVAWSYFDRWTNLETGLCPATVNFSTGSHRLHEAVTMWDVGSHINALMAAADLKLITAETFQRSIRKILPNIAGRRSQGRLLPQGWIVTNKVRWGDRNFDGCDAGRLLAALYNLDTHPLAKDKSAPTVASWNLEDVVKEGIVFSVESGQLKSTFTSHCAHYAAWAFRTWGIEVRSPYEVFQGKSEADGQMALLEVSGRIGPLGAEPLLMEALELGMSPESAYLADVLFAAQLEEFEATGKLVCVSEGPISSPPWFLYQGLQFDVPGRVWATDTVEGLEEHRTEAFRDKHLAISSKAAYLWSAYKDHPFCDTLVGLVREKAKSSFGFASSINQRTGEASLNYTDINTNAVILQSIAHMLKAAP
tara:strand:+ start:5071 stop:7617 length:2547 start_codon:yes stop_codon:yes gene_type:complete